MSHDDEELKPVWNLIKCIKCHYILALCYGDKIMLCRGGTEMYTRHAEKHERFNSLSYFHWNK